MLGTVIEKQFYSNNILKTIKIQYSKNMAQRQKRQVENLCQEHSSEKKKKKERIQWSLVQQVNKYCNQN